MSIWNSILQASHSALIDTLNETFPKDKLELGLPKRFDSWGTTEGPDHVLLQEIVTGEGKGILALAVRTADGKIGKGVFDQTRTHAEKEFKLRNIDAHFGKPIETPPSLRMTIWLPIRVVKKSDSPIFDLGVGI